MESGQFIVEGERAVADAVDAGIHPDLIVVREDYAPASIALANVIDAAEGRLRVLDAARFDSVTDTVHPQGVLAILPLPPQFGLAADASLIVLLDGIRDPGNMGTLLRSAAAAGVDAVVIGDGSVDVYNPKVVRAAMGAHFRVPILALSDVDPERLTSVPLRAMAEAGANQDYDQVGWAGPALLVIGSEADGPGPMGRALATTGIAIPMTGGIESLNAAVAGSVILFEIARQRRTGR